MITSTSPTRPRVSPTLDPARAESRPKADLDKLRALDTEAATRTLEDTSAPAAKRDLAKQGAARTVAQGADLAKARQLDAERTPAGPATSSAKANAPRRGLTPNEDAAPTDAPDTAPPAPGGGPPSIRDSVVQERLRDYAGQAIPPAAELDKKLEKTKAWSALSPEDRAATREQLRADGDEGKLIRAQVNEALGAPDFAERSADEQLQTLEPAVFPSLPASPRTALDDVQHHPAFQSLPKEDRAAIEKVLQRPGWEGDALAQMTEGLRQGQPDPAREKAIAEQMARTAKVMDDPSLKGPARDAVVDAHLYDRPPHAASKVLETMRGAPEVQKLPAKARSALLAQTARDLGPRPEGAPPPPAVSEAETRKALQNDPAYQALPAEKRDPIARLTSGDTPIAQGARARLGALMNSAAYKNGGAKTRAAMLNNLPHLGALPYGVNNVTPSEKPNGTTEVTGKRDVTARFERGEGPAVEHDVAITRGDRTFQVKVQMPKEQVPGRHTPSLAQVRDALTRLPDDQLNSLQKVVVNPDGRPGDGMSTMGDDGTVQISPAHSPGEAKERFAPGAMSEVLNHEVGHLQSITPWSNDENSPGWQRWDAARNKDGLSASDYAKQNGPEDFAETYALYRSAENRPAELAQYRKMFPHRFAIIDELVKAQKNKRS